MKLYKLITYWCGWFAGISLVISLSLHYIFGNCTEASFWINIFLAIFGSAVLSCATSLLTYFHEKRKELKSFMHHTKQIIHFLNKYQTSMSLEQKINFFLVYNDFDKTAWEDDFRNMDFFFQNKEGDKKYIYDSIYQPINVFSSAVAKYSWNFRWHMDGSGRNENVMLGFVNELEQYLITKTENEVPTEYNDDGSIKKVCKIQGESPRLVREIFEQLNGRYYEIMYGKGSKGKLEETNNGQA